MSFPMAANGPLSGAIIPILIGPCARAAPGIITSNVNASRPTHVIMDSFASEGDVLRRSRRHPLLGDAGDLGDVGDYRGRHRRVLHPRLEYDGRRRARDDSRAAPA